MTRTYVRVFRYKFDYPVFRVSGCVQIVRSGLKLFRRVIVRKLIVPIKYVTYGGCGGKRRFYNNGSKKPYSPLFSF